MFFGPAVMAQRGPDGRDREFKHPAWFLGRPARLIRRGNEPGVGYRLCVHRSRTRLSLKSTTRSSSRGTFTISAGNTSSAAPEQTVAV